VVILTFFKTLLGPFRAPLRSASIDRYNTRSNKHAIALLVSTSTIRE
jgi:hypothetical protein